MHAIPAAVTVACTTAACAAAGRRARVYIRQVAPGVVDWPDLRCVWCGSHVTRVEEDDMAKITIHGGATNAREYPPAAAPPPAVLVPVVATPPVVPDPVPVDPPEDVPAEQVEAAPTETDQAAAAPAEPPAPKLATRGRGRARKAQP